MSWLLFAIISISFSVTYSLISKKLLTKDEESHPIAFASSSFLIVAIYSGILYLLNGPDANDFRNLSDPALLPLLAINLLAYSIAPSFYWRALKYLPVSEVGILYSLTGFYALFLGVALGKEEFSVARLLGGLLIIAAIALVSLKKQPWSTGKYFLMLVVATAFYAIAIVTDKAIIDTGKLSPIFFQMLNFGIPAIIVLVINRVKWSDIKPVWSRSSVPLICINALFFFFSVFTIYKAYEAGGEASQVNLVVATEVVILVTISSVLLDERKNLLKKVIAAILAMIGIYLISMS
jgi:drug/metabolite transporter (DMT)-like permease